MGSLTTLLAQSSREDFIKARKSSYESFKKAKREEFTAFSEKQNEDFVKHLNEQWTLLENYKKENMPLSKPKPKDVPVVPDYVDNDIDVDNDVIIDIDIDTDADRENDIVVEDDNKGDDNILVKSKDLVEFNFYGEKVAVVVDEKLRLTLNGVDEASIANYFATISQYREATKLLWTDLTKKANTFGLNDWGKFVMVRKLSEKLFDNHNDCVLFCFYMLRNEGGKKVRIARGGVSNKLLMLMSVEESRILYKYSYFNFTEENACQLQIAAQIIILFTHRELGAANGTAKAIIVKNNGFGFVVFFYGFFTDQGAILMREQVVCMREGEEEAKARRTG